MAGKRPNLLFLASLTVVFDSCSSLSLEFAIQSKKLSSRALLSTMFVSQCFSFKIAEKSGKAKEAEWQNQLQLDTSRIILGMLLHFLLVVQIPSFRSWDFLPSTGVSINSTKEPHI